MKFKKEETKPIILEKLVTDASKEIEPGPNMEHLKALQKAAENFDEEEIGVVLKAIIKNHPDLVYGFLVVDHSDLKKKVDRIMKITGEMPL